VSLAKLNFIDTSKVVLKSPMQHSRIGAKLWKHSLPWKTFLWDSTSIYFIDFSVVNIFQKMSQNIWFRITSNHSSYRKTHHLEKCYFKLEYVHKQLSNFKFNPFISCSQITEEAFKNMNQDWKDLKSVEKLGLFLGK